MNYYELLEISPSASVEVIRNAYKTLAKKYHPDTYGGDGAFAEEKMKLLNEAISVLEDEDKRKEYNKINGINPLSKSGYSAYGRNNMLNVDENGEPIFFSYDSDLDGFGDSDDGDDSPQSYMDVIDDFLNNSKSEKKSKSPKKSAKPIKKKEFSAGGIIDDIDDIDDISEISSENAGKNKNEIEFNYDNIYDSKDIESIEEFKTLNLRGKSGTRGKSKANPPSNKNRLYYIFLASLVAADIFLGILVVQSVDWDNIKDIMSGVSGNPNAEDDSVGNFGIEDYTDENEYDFAFEDITEPEQAVIPATEPVIENTTEETTEQATEIIEPAVITTALPAVTAAPVVVPPRTQAITNPPVTTAAPTEPIKTTEPTIEETTIDETAIIETTEEFTASESVSSEIIEPNETNEITEETSDAAISESESVSETEPVVSESETAPETTEPPFEYEFDYDYLITEEE